MKEDVKDIIFIIIIICVFESPYWISFGLICLSPCVRIEFYLVCLTTLHIKVSGHT